MNRNFSVDILACAVKGGPINFCENARFCFCVFIFQRSGKATKIVNFDRFFVFSAKKCGHICHCIQNSRERTTRTRTWYVYVIVCGELELRIEDVGCWDRMERKRSQLNAQSESRFLDQITLSEQREWVYFRQISFKKRKDEKIIGKIRNQCASHRDQWGLLSSLSLPNLGRIVILAKELKGSAGF